MRYSIIAEKIGTHKIPIKYRTSISYMIKNTFYKNPEIVGEYYNKKNKVVKPYSFECYFDDMKILNDEIIFKDRFKINFTSLNDDLFNASWKGINCKKTILLNNINFEIKSIKKYQPDIKNYSSTFKCDLSILTDVYAPSNKNIDEYYLSPNYDLDTFNNNLNLYLKKKYFYMYNKMYKGGNIRFIPINIKDNYISHYERMKAFYGSFKLTGDKELIDIIYHGGLGVRTGQGFGYVKEIR